MNTTKQFIRVESTLVDVLRGEPLMKFRAVRAGCASHESLQVADILALTAKAVWDEGRQCWAVIEPIRWNPTTGADPLKLRYVPKAVEVELPA